ncbi:MAG TPA: gamma-glutamyl-gamma-aminobutyrate hydrolase family protein, partial [Desulfosarcina sp.]|nr:gamma-glutamyl-gamma-aminobutyrate hydrolase family protein [Desulfosarcina sp.]
DALFAAMPSPFRAARYHSLMVQPSPAALDQELMITGQAPDGTIMGLSHRHLPLHGVQFHPESFLTEHGFTIVENFLRLGPLKSVLDRHSPAASLISTPAKAERSGCFLQARAS